MKRIAFYLFLLSLIVVSGACHRGEGKEKNLVNPEDTLPGRKVIAYYADSVPGVVQFFKVDAAGNLTPELEREVQYFPNRQKYIDCRYTTLKTDSGLLNVKNGPAFAYFEDGTLQVEAHYAEGKQTGKYKIYRENGKLFLEGRYEEDLRVGEWKFYDQEGRLAKKGSYERGNCAGEWIDYASDGKVRRTVVADEHTIGCGDCPKCKKLTHNK